MVKKGEGRGTISVPRLGLLGLTEKVVVVFVVVGQCTVHTLVKFVCLS